MPILRPPGDSALLALGPNSESTLWVRKGPRNAHACEMDLPLSAGHPQDIRGRAQMSFLAPAHPRRARHIRSRKRARGTGGAQPPEGSEDDGHAKNSSFQKPKRARQSGQRRQKARNRSRPLPGPPPRGDQEPCAPGRDDSESPNPFGNAGGSQG